MAGAEWVAAARRQTRNTLGVEAETKATDAFCQRVMAVADSSAPGMASVLEFETSAWHEAATQVATARAMTLSRLAPVRAALDHPVDERPPTQVCWLNQSVRTWASPSAVAEAAVDPGVIGLDVARRPAGPVGAQRAGHRVDPELVQDHCTGSGIRLAVLDSEVARHPALDGRVVYRGNYSAEAWGHPHRHGTALAGLLASDDEEFPGAVSDGVVLCYKVLGHRRSDDSDDFGAALALQQALEDGAAVAVCAWGAGPIRPDFSLAARAVDQAWALGLVVVKSAGNRGPRVGSMSSPAEAAGLLVVGATDVGGTAVQRYSSRGPAGDRVGPDVVAPGGSWWGRGTGPELLTLARVSGGFGPLGVGTSYAAALVAGLAARHLTEYSHLTPSEVRRDLVAAATPLDDGSGPEAQGAGLLQSTAGVGRID